MITLILLKSYYLNLKHDKGSVKFIRNLGTTARKLSIKFVIICEKSDAENYSLEELENKVGTKYFYFLDQLDYNYFSETKSQKLIEDIIHIELQNSSHVCLISHGQSAFEQLLRVESSERITRLGYGFLPQHRMFLQSFLLGVKNMRIKSFVSLFYYLRSLFQTLTNLYYLKEKLDYFVVQDPKLKEYFSRFAKKTVYVPSSCGDIARKNASSEKVRPLRILLVCAPGSHSMIELNYFFKKIMPRYKKLGYKFQFTIIGVTANMVKRYETQHEDLCMLPYVDDVRSIYEKNDVLLSCSSLKLGSSTRVKDAIRNGLACVVHEATLFGLIELQSSIHCLSACNPDEFLEKLRYLDENRRDLATIVQKAYETYDQDYSLSAFEDNWSSLFSQILKLK